jgi:hypothetical protein
MKASLGSFLRPPVTSCVFSPNILLSALISKTLSLCSFRMRAPFQKKEIFMTKLSRNEAHEMHATIYFSIFFFFIFSKILKVKYKKTVMLLNDNNKLLILADGSDKCGFEFCQYFYLIILDYLI